MLETWLTDRDLVDRSAENVMCLPGRRQAHLSLKGKTGRRQSSHLDLCSKGQFFAILGIETLQAVKQRPPTIVANPLVLSVNNLLWDFVPFTL